MADYQSIAGASRSIARYLSHCYATEQPVPGNTTTAVLTRTEDFVSGDSGSVITTPALSIYLYRVDVDNTMRAAWSAVGSRDGRSHLPLELHFLLTPWAANATDEHRILGRTMQCLDSTPILSGPLLDPITEWSTHEAIQVFPDTMSTEAVMRTFDSLPIDYKLSVCYGARIVRIDGRIVREDMPVTTLATGLEPRAKP